MFLFIIVMTVVLYQEGVREKGSKCYWRRKQI